MVSIEPWEQFRMSRQRDGKQTRIWSGKEADEHIVCYFTLLTLWCCSVILGNKKFILNKKIITIECISARPLFQRHWLQKYFFHTFFLKRYKMSSLKCYKPWTKPTRYVVIHKSTNEGLHRLVDFSALPWRFQLDRKFSANIWHNDSFE